jgi:hypothetical protein
MSHIHRQASTPSELGQTLTSVSSAAVELRLIPDQAIGEPGGRGVDGLGFAAYAQVLASAARQTPGPFTIGVFGEWGEGKTSLLRLIQAQLSGDETVVTVWFNAWRYEREEHPILPLIGTIVQELEKPNGLVDRLGEKVSALLQALRAVAYAFSVKATIGVPGVGVEAGWSGRDAIHREQELAQTLLDRSLYHEAFGRLDRVELPSSLRVVVLIDDLDRCHPDKAMWLLESIKLVLGQPGFVFVLAVARQVIEGFLSHRYAEEFGIKDFGGEQYLDKIVQLPFRIPRSNARYSQLGQSLLAGQPEKVAEAVRSLLPALALALRANPRALVRFINNILIDAAISAGLAEVQVAHIPIGYFAVSRCLEYGWPRVLEVLSDDDTLAEEVSTWDSDQARQRAEGDASDGAALVAGAMVAAPQLHHLLTGPVGRDWLTQAHLRRASVEFLVNQDRLSTLDTSEVSSRGGVYLSYAAGDRDKALTIVEALSEIGVPVRFDISITLGERWTETLDRAFRDSQVVCFLVGPATAESGEQIRELTRLDVRSKSVMPIVLPGSHPDRIPNDLRPFRFLDLSGGLTDEGLRELVDAVRRFALRS